MQKINTKVGKLTRGILAILLALVDVGVALPNAGHFVFHAGVSSQIGYDVSFHDRLIVCIWPAVPLACIFIGILSRHALLEYIGWALLVILVAANL